MPHRFAAIPAALSDAMPFVGPDTLERLRGRPFRARIGANESGFGPSPSVIDAIRRKIPEAWRYGDENGHALREAIAEANGAQVENVVLGEGIDGLLGLTCRLFLNPGDAAATLTGAYPTFNYHVEGYGGRIAARPYRAFAPDLDALFGAARESGAKLVYLANPDNPTGAVIPGAEVAARLDDLPEGALFLHDEAYAEFDPAAALPVAADDPRVIRFRTFSKAYGMAGLRVGYALAAPDVAAGFNRIRNHFGVGNIAQAAALAALRDQGWLAEVVRRAGEAKARIAAIARASGLDPQPSSTNFVAIDCGDAARSTALVAALEARDVFIRRPGAAPLGRLVRVSASSAGDLDVFEAELPQALTA